VGGFAVVRATSGSSSASSFVPVSPVRVLDTRSDLGLAAVTDGVAGTLKVTGSIPTATSNGVVNAVVVPAGATAVVLNVTAVNPTAGGYVSLRPGDATGAPTVSTLNVTAGGTFPNGATITIPTTGAHAGEIQVWYEAEYTTVGSTELLIDIAGYYELAGSGTAGATGPAGPAGPQGETGFAGPAGHAGPTGPAGPQGETGPAGPAGPAGPQGETGPAGANGTTTNSQIKNICGVNGTSPCAVGQQGPGGGIVFMTPSTPGNTSGLFYEAAPSTWYSPSGDPTSVWCNNTSNLLGVASQSTGTGAMDGAAKTTVMLGVCTSGAANLADAYTVTVNGVVYGDWFLPSKGELNQMYVNKSAIGGFSTDFYWSSSESSDSYAWGQDFYSGIQTNYVKTFTFSVRPVRAFAATLALACADGGVCAVGDTGPGGGKVFYVHASGTFACGATLSSTCKYLEAASTSGTAAWTDALYAWSGNTSEAIGADAQGTAIGTGYKNTQAMVTQSSTAGRAGTVTRAYRGPNSLSDWYLPSQDELNQMYVNIAAIGGFASGGYWSSSEVDAYGAWGQYFGVGAPDYDYKAFSDYVRPVRAFGGTVACADGGVCAVGETGPGGGKVFYVHASGTFACGPTLSSTCKYLEAAPTSGTAAWTDALYAWSGNTSEAIGADAQGTAIGTGYKNTQAMVTQSSTAGMAGTVTRAYRGPNSLSDWYLPSKDELNQMYVNKSAIGGFTSNWHWSSSEFGDGSASIQDFNSGLQDYYGKLTTFSVRPVRAF
jgi:hypothetical protein